VADTYAFEILTLSLNMKGKAISARYRMSRSRSFSIIIDMKETKNTVRNLSEIFTKTKS
jgi:hypothetical protein